MVSDAGILQCGQDMAMSDGGVGFGGTQLVLALVLEVPPLVWVLCNRFDYLFREVQGVLHLENAQNSGRIDKLTERDGLQGVQAVAKACTLATWEK